VCKGQDKLTEVRLVQGPVCRGNLVGRLEVMMGGVWGRVCDTDFDDIDAKIACNSMGLL
jgi:hypothetical protein